MIVSAPRTLDEALSPEWLSAALGTRFPGVRIAEVHPGAIDARVSTNAPFQVAFDGIRPEGLPSALCLKAYFGEPGSPGHNARHVGIVETRVYRELVPQLGFRTLDAVYAEVDEEAEQGVIITADVLAQGGSFPDPRIAMSPELVSHSLEELAKLHAATWGAAPLGSAAWLAPRMEPFLAIDASVVRRSYEGPVGAGMPERVRDADRLVAAYRALAAELTAVARGGGASPGCVMHGDAHPGNLFLDAEGHLSFLDWQLTQRGAWYADVSYHLASCLTVEDRREREHDLLEHYLDALAGHGIEVPARTAAWEGYRRGMVHGLFLWSITQKTHPTITSTMLTRLAIAADDLDALEHLLAG